MSFYQNLKKLYFQEKSVNLQHTQTTQNFFQFVIYQQNQYPILEISKFPGSPN